MSTNEITKAISILSDKTLRGSVEILDPNFDGDRKNLEMKYVDLVIKSGQKNFLSKLDDASTNKAVEALHITLKSSKEENLKSLEEALPNGIKPLLEAAEESLLHIFCKVLGLEEETSKTSKADMIKHIPDEIMLTGMEVFLHKLTPTVLKQHATEMKIDHQGSKEQLVERLMVYIFELEPLGNNTSTKNGDGKSSETKSKKKGSKKAAPEKKTTTTKKGSSSTEKKTTSTNEKRTTSNDKKKKEIEEKQENEIETKSKKRSRSPVTISPSKSPKSTKTSSPSKSTTTSKSTRSASPKRTSSPKRSTSPPPKRSSSPKKAVVEKKVSPKKKEKSSKASKEKFVADPISSIVKGKNDTANLLRDKYNLPDLEKYCQVNNLPHSGKKESIIKRIVDHLNGKAPVIKPSSNKKRKSPSSTKSKSEESSSKKSTKKTKDHYYYYYKSY